MEYLTKDKFDELTKKLAQLRTQGRKEVAEELQYSKQLGDISENAEYQAAREKQGMLEDEISRLDSLLKSATIVDTHHTNAVAVGSVVEIQKDGKNEPVKYTIVGVEEADMAKKKLSITSPLGAALKGKKKGETFKFQAPGGMVTYKVVNIA